MPYSESHLPPSSSNFPAPVTEPAAPVAPEPVSADASAHAGAVAAEAETLPKTKDKATKKRLSAGMGAACLAGGVLGLAVPGLPGWPLLIIGASVLAPKVPLLSKANEWMKERFPDAHAGALHFEDRFLTDLEKRYPDKPAAEAKQANPAEARPVTEAELVQVHESQPVVADGQQGTSSKS